MKFIMCFLISVSSLGWAGETTIYADIAKIREAQVHLRIRHQWLTQLTSGVLLSSTTASLQKAAYLRPFTNPAFYAIAGTSLALASLGGVAYVLDTPIPHQAGLPLAGAGAALSTWGVWQWLRTQLPLRLQPSLQGKLGTGLVVFATGIALFIGDAPAKNDFLNLSDEELVARAQRDPQFARELHELATSL